MAFRVMLCAMPKLLQAKPEYFLQEQPAPSQNTAVQN